MCKTKWFVAIPADTPRRIQDVSLPLISPNNPTAINKIGFLFFLIAFLVQTVSAQTNFVDGTVITNENDTLRGQIDFQGWDRNPSHIMFRREGVTRKYEPIQLKAFNVSGVQYVSGILPVEQYSLQVRNMTSQANPETRRDTVFLELVVSGVANLYYLNDRNSITHFFFQPQDGEVRELSNYRFVKITDEGKKIVSNPKRYMGTLNSLMKDCIDITKEQPEYKMSDMKDLFLRYNQCKSPSSSYVATNRRKLLFEPGLVVGASLTAFSLKAGGTDEKAKASPSLNASFGLALNIVLPANNRRWSINNDLTYRAFSSSTETNGIVNGYNAVTSYYFDVVGIKLANALRYHTSAKSVRPFFNVGIFNSFAIKNDNKRVQVLYLNSDVVGGLCTTTRNSEDKYIFIAILFKCACKLFTCVFSICEHRVKVLVSSLMVPQEIND